MLKRWPQGKAKELFLVDRFNVSPLVSPGDKGAAAMKRSPKTVFDEVDCSIVAGKADIFMPARLVGHRFLRLYVCMYVCMYELRIYELSTNMYVCMRLYINPGHLLHTQLYQ